jgi:hypothetical protein
MKQSREPGQASPTVVGAVALIALIASVGVWTSTRGDDDPGTNTGNPGLSGSASATVDPGNGDDGDDEGRCDHTATRPAIDLGVQASRGSRKPHSLTVAQVRALVGKAQRAGATIISTSANFRSLKPTEDGPYRWDNLDRVVDLASEAGLSVKLRMVWPPVWAYDERPVMPRQAPRSDAELAVWEGFVRDVMEHVEGKVGYVEVWTEPDSLRYWPTGPDPVEFARLLDVSARAIHEVSPETKVVAGGLRGNAVGYLEALYEAFDKIGLESTPFDMLGVEPFNGGRPPEEYDEGRIYQVDPFGDVDGNFLGFETLHEVMADHGDGDLPIYITLFGYSTVGNEENPGVDDATRATYLTTALDLVACRPYVGAFSWYALHPNPWDAAEWTLVNARGDESLTYDALVAWADAGS